MRAGAQGHLKLSQQIGNEHLTFVSMAPKALKLPESCPVEPGYPIQVKTLSGLEYLARKGVLYFNLHQGAHLLRRDARPALRRAGQVAG